MIKKILTVSIIGALLLCLYSPFVFAQGVLYTGRATVYKVTMSSFEIDNGDGSTPITAFSGASATLDIASAADTNTSVGNFLSGLTVPDGSYSRVKPTPSGTFTIAGSVTHAGNGNTYYTRSTTGSGTGCTVSTTPPAQECTVNLNVGPQDWQNLPGTITVTNGIPSHRVRVRFNTSAALGLYTVGGDDPPFEIFPQQPQTTVTLIAQ